MSLQNIDQIVQGLIGDGRDTVHGILNAGLPIAAPLLYKTLHKLTKHIRIVVTIWN